MLQNSSLLKRAINQLVPDDFNILSNLDTSLMNPSQFSLTYLSRFTISVAIASMDFSRFTKYSRVLIGSSEIEEGTVALFAKDCRERKMSSYLITVNKLILSISI